MTRKRNKFGAKYGNQENITEKPKSRKMTEGENTYRFSESITQKIPNWKILGLDGIHGVWLKKFTSIHDRLAIEMNRCLQEADVLEWMTKGKIILIQKDPRKRTALINYRPITCLHMMWKILMAQIREEIYYSLIRRRLFFEEQKECHKGTRGIVKLLDTDQNILT